MVITPSTPVNLTLVCVYCKTAVDVVVSNVFHIKIDDSPCKYMPVTAAAVALEEKVFDYYVYYDLDFNRFPTDAANSTEFLLDI
mmetsp:Transcript_11859/g.18294  ORF Transcript_11859/g.18294 Transcript_11859/m.18294 type:complete len:84 (+) Transcript_11859:1489-1740(+)